MSQQNSAIECIRFSLSSESLSDQQLSELLARLRRDVAALPEVKKIETPQSVVKKEGAKGGEIVDLLTTLVVPLSLSTGTALLMVLRDWAKRNRRVTIKYQQDGEIAEISAPSKEAAARIRAEHQANRPSLIIK